nr:50S ribosomal protein L18P [uncultured archaeon]
MAKNARYRLSYKRRRETKTDYQARRILATSEHPRFVVRTSNKGIIAQVIKSENIGDKVITQATSNELFSKYGWKASGKNIPAAYLLGLIAGYKTIKNGTEVAFLDLGLKRPTKGSKVFAVVKGAIDAGLNVPCDSDIIPPPERINGQDTANFAKEMAPEKYESFFSIYLRRGLRPEQLPGHFEDVKKKIQDEWSK